MALKMFLGFYSQKGLAEVAKDGAKDVFFGLLFICKRLN